MDLNRVFWIVPLMLFTACEAVDSSDVRTSGIYASFAANADGTGGTTVRAELKVGPNSNTYLDLVSGDALTASQGEESSEMQKNNLGSMVWYETQFMSAAADTEFSIAFERAEDDNAPDSRVSLPAPFDLTVPAPDEEFFMSVDRISVAWNNTSDDVMKLTVSGSCFFGISEELNTDEGVYVIEPTVLEPIDAGANETCVATVALTREREGSVDAAFGEGGVFAGRQSRSVEILVRP